MNTHFVLQIGLGQLPHLIVVFALLALSAVYCYRCRTLDSVVMTLAQVFAALLSIVRVVLICAQILFGVQGGRVAAVGHTLLTGVGFLVQVAFVVGFGMLVLIDSGVHMRLLGSGRVGRSRLPRPSERPSPRVSGHDDRDQHLCRAQSAVDAGVRVRPVGSSAVVD